MKKKLFFILLILLIVLNYFCSNSYATSNITSNVNVDYNPYEYMRNDTDILKNWARNNFSNYNDFTTFVFEQFGELIPNSRRYFFVDTDSYFSNTGSISIILYSQSNISTFSTFNYYGGTAKCFITTGSMTRFTIRPSDSSLSGQHFVSSYDTVSSARNVFIGYYNLKVDYAFSDSDFYDEINNNLSEIATSVEDTQNYLSDNTAYSDEELSTDKSNVANVVQPEIDKLNQSSFFSTIYGFYNHIINADTESFKKDTLDIDFYIFNTHVTGTLERNYTNDLLLRICNNDTVTRNMIRNLIRSTYYLIFFLFFAKKYIDAFHKIITANFDGFHSGVELINAL